MTWTTADEARRAGAIDVEAALEHARTDPAAYRMTYCRQCAVEIYVPRTVSLCGACRHWLDQLAGCVAAGCETYDLDRPAPRTPLLPAGNGARPMTRPYTITNHLRHQEPEQMTTNHEALQAAADYVTNLRRQLEDLSRQNNAAATVGFPPSAFDEWNLRTELAQAETDLHALRTGPAGDLEPSTD